MKTEFKINSATQQAASLRVDAAREIMRYAGISKSTWRALVFEMGCAFVEQEVYLRHLWVPLLQNKELGFWDWWLIIWTEDDQLLTGMNTVTDLKTYRREKLTLLRSDAAAHQFRLFLNRNKFINGKV